MHILNPYNSTCQTTLNNRAIPVKSGVKAGGSRFQHNAVVVELAPVALLLALLASPSAARADGGVAFHDVAGESLGLAYSRTRSADYELLRQLQVASLSAPLPIESLITKPEMTGGQPGVVLWDYDRDDDLDLYVSNGPGSANSLFQNQLSQTGALGFVDVAEPSGAAAVDQDSAGVCAGDLDNDGDPDLVVLGRGEPNRLFANRGNGTFREVYGSGIEGGALMSTSCSLGDIDGDGLLDVLIGNLAPLNEVVWIYVEPYALNEHNQLFRNQGGLSFEDMSHESGIEDLAGLAPGFEGSATPTHAVAMVDVDLDGDPDLVFADDQAAVPPTAAGGADRGMLRILVNDGTGHFTDQPISAPSPITGQWMGLGFGDLDCNGTLDLFASNLGDYGFGSLGAEVPLGSSATRWFLGRGDGTFTDPGVGELGATAFAWGNAVFDYDNDGDLDLLSHGGLDISFLTLADNPGTIFQNQGCSARFRLDSDAIAQDPTCTDATGAPIPGCTAHIRRNVRGVAVGDLDRNGFTDVVTVADVVNREPLPLVDAPDDWGAGLDGTAFFVPTFELTPEGFVWTGLDSSDGDLAVELATDNGNGSLSVRVAGGAGLAAWGRVNRDGIGAVLSVTPKGGATVTLPITAGSSHLSQHALEKVFGLAAARRATVEVLWPGGVRNRLYGARAGERVVMPEIPCSFDAGLGFADYLACVRPALEAHHEEGTIDARQRARLWAGALRAFWESAAAEVGGT